MPGTLFIVATPIGNLEDLTFRALRTLREVDVIAAEDTRRTAKLLARYEVRKPLVSLREHNEVRETPRLIGRLQAGEDVALVSDAGTPGISDPGARLVRAVRDAGVAIVPIPGASAVTTALSSVGVPGDQFAFLGFAPATGKARTAWMESASKERRPLVAFEAPHRVRRTVQQLIDLGIKPIYAYRELTKLHEQLVICTTRDDTSKLAEIGEYTLVAEPKNESPVQVDEIGLMRDYDSLQGAASIDRSLVFEFLGFRHGLAPDVVRKIIKKAKILAERQTE